MSGLCIIGYHNLTDDTGHTIGYGSLLRPFCLLADILSCAVSPVFGTPFVLLFSWTTHLWLNGPTSTYGSTYVLTESAFSLGRISSIQIKDEQYWIDLKKTVLKMHRPVMRWILPHLHISLYLWTPSSSTPHSTHPWNLGQPFQYMLSQILQGSDFGINQTVHLSPVVLLSVILLVTNVCMYLSYGSLLLFSLV